MNFSEIKNWRRSIKGKMIASNILLFLITIVSISVFVWLLTRQTLQDSTVNKIELAISLKKDSVRLWVHELERDLVWLTKMESIKQQAKQLVLQTKKQERNKDQVKRLRQYINSIRNLKRDWQEVFLLSNDGEILMSTNAAREGDYRTLDTYFVEGRKAPYIQKI
ncbi:MAG: hypothetical protein OQJ89_06375, partial [Kangiellaceae bacterium]|nr:hypothetical protein [Kangiellaceae bacterium]